ncbi:MAG: shikimate kinase, partial [Actinobacteria bacterium]|nr:shikimate kinase [Actinomycetota bacterium]
MRSKDNISLIGFMGSGKTTTGEILAEKLGYIFMDLDRIIELDESKTIYEIFKSCGEDYFRDIESKVIKKIYLNNRCVFACGGGVILRGENMRIIGKNSRVIYLEISPREAVNRLTGASDRPLLQSKNNFENIAELMKSRSSLYKKYSDI